MRARVVMAAAIVFLSVAASALAARPEPRIDNTTLESFRSSWKELVKPLNRSQQQQLQFAVLRIAMSGYKSASDVPDSLGSIGPETVRGQIAGMTYSEIMTLANKSPTTVETVPPCDSKPSANPCVKNK